MRVLLPVHDLTKTSLDNLGNLWNKYLKISPDFPQLATNVIFHSELAMNTSSVSDLYKEGNGLSHLSSRIKRDSVANHVINSKLDKVNQNSTCQSENVTYYWS